MDTLLNPDFGSESEDDNFNPAPAVGSDDEDGGESDREDSRQPKTNGTTQSRYSPTQESHTGDGVEEQELATNGKTGSAANLPKAEDDEAEEDDEEDDEVEAEVARQANGVSGKLDEDEDEEDEEDDEDDEDAVSVCQSSRAPGSPSSQFSRDGHVSEAGGNHEINLST